MTPIPTGFSANFSSHDAWFPLTFRDLHGQCDRLTVPVTGFHDGSLMSNKEERILEAAGRLFSRYGLKKTTVDEIAQEAGVGKGTIYLYFESKEKIFTKLAYQNAGRVLHKMADAVGGATSVVDQLYNLILARFRYVDELVKYHDVNLEYVAKELKPSTAEVTAEFRKHELELLERVIRDGVRGGELEVSEREIPVVSLALSASLEALEMPWVVEGRELPIERKAEVLVRLFIKGLQRT